MNSRRNVSSLMLVVCLFRDLTKFLSLCSRLEQVSPKRLNRKEKGHRMYTHPCIELCLTKWQGQAVSGSQNEENEFLEDESIY